MDRLHRVDGTRACAEPVGPVATAASRARARARAHRLVSGLLLIALGGCGLFGGDKKPATLGLIGGPGETQTVAYPDGAGLNLPPSLAGFQRLDAVETGRSGGVLARYRRTDPAGDVLATIRLQHRSNASIIPFTSGANAATAPASDAALNAIVAGLRAREPGLAATGSRNIYQLRFGTLQSGREATLQSATERRLVEAFCCIDQNWLYSFTFTAPATLDPTPIADQFTRALPWSADPKASIADIE